MAPPTTKNLGVSFDSFISLSLQIQSISKACWDNLKNIISCALLPIFFTPAVTQVTITDPLDVDICSSFPPLFPLLSTSNHFPHNSQVICERSKSAQGISTEHPSLTSHWTLNKDQTPYIGHNGPVWFDPTSLVTLTWSHSPFCPSDFGSLSRADICWILSHLSAFVHAVLSIWNVFRPSVLCLKIDPGFVSMGSYILSWSLCLMCIKLIKVNIYYLIVFLRI